MFCAEGYTRHVFRNKDCKWYVTYDEYEREEYPRYCSGFAVLFANDTVEKLYHGAQRTNFFWVDDVAITGVVAETVNITPKDAGELINDKVYSQLHDGNLTLEEIHPFLVGSFGCEDEQMRWFWDLLTAENNKNLKKI
jgi:hypothetical protein